MNDLNKQKIEDLKNVVKAYIDKYGFDPYTDIFQIDGIDSVDSDNFNKTSFEYSLSFNGYGRRINLSFNEETELQEPRIVLLESSKDENRFTLSCYVPLNYCLSFQLDKWLNFFKCLFKDTLDEENILININKYFGLDKEIDFYSIEDIIKWVQSGLLVQYGYAKWEDCRTIESYLRIWLNTPSFWKMFLHCTWADYQIKIADFVEFDDEHFVFDDFVAWKLEIRQHREEMWVDGNMWPQTIYTLKLIDKQKGD